MKTKIILFVLVTSLLTSCSKLPYGEGSESDIILTENNYIYEGDLFKYTLNIQIDSLEARAKELIVLSGQDPKFKDELEDTNALLIEVSAIEQNVPAIANIIDQVGRRNPIPPRPPRPDVLPDGLQYILRYDLQSLSIEGTNQDSNLVLESEEGYLSPLPGTKGLIQIQEINTYVLQSNDIVTLRIKRTNNKKKFNEYLLNVKVRK